MSYYRELNKELVVQVQKMRKDMKLCYDEIVRLKGELVEKHESEVILRKECYNWAVNNFVQLIQCIKPDSDILPILKEHKQSRRSLSSSTSSTDGKVPRMSKRYSERFSTTCASNSTLSRELQRSNSLINLRKSISNTSPIRRNSNNDNDEDGEEQNDQYIQQEQENEECTENELYEAELINTDVVNIIYEESETEEDLDVESVYESVDEVDDTSHIRSTLKEVTNILTDTINSTKEGNNIVKNIPKRGQSKRANKTNLKLSDQENTITSRKFCSDSDSEQTVISNITKHQGKLSDNTVVDMELSLEEPRIFIHVEDLSDRNKSLPIKHGNNHTHDVSVSYSPSLVYTDMTLRNFKNVACSTPNSIRNSTLTATPPLKIDSVTDLESAALSASTSISTRPSRRCKPKCLAEPTINTKLRNENPTVSKRSNSKSKSKSKK